MNASLVADHILEVQGLEFSLGELRILNSLSLTVSRGETLGIIGPNGSGKTTFFNCLSGFVFPDAGSIRLAGQEISSLPPFQRARLGLGRVFQNFGIFREMTVLENMLVALERNDSPFRLPWNRQHQHHIEIAKNTLNKFDLKEKFHSRASSLSGGQLRLLEIARTVALGAEVFLLDEPTSGVSPKMKSGVELALKVLAEMGKTLIVIEHDMSFIERICQRIVAIDMGATVIDGPPAAVRSDPLLAEIYFGKGV